MTSTSKSTEQSPRVIAQPSSRTAASTSRARSTRVRAVAEQAGVAHRRRRRARADLVVVLGGDGTMLRTLAKLLGSERAGDRRQLRPRRLPRVDPAGRSRARSRAGLRRRVRDGRAADAPGAARRRAARRSQRRRRHELDARPHGRARLGGRRRGSRHRPLRRHDLLDAVGLDGVQPLERRPRARPRPRRDGGHVHRAALAPRAAARRPARRGGDGPKRTADVAATLLVDGHRVGEAPARRGGRRSTSASSGACSRRCPETTFFSRYRETSRPDSRCRRRVPSLRWHRCSAGSESRTSSSSGRPSSSSRPD